MWPMLLLLLVGGRAEERNLSGPLSQDQRANLVRMKRVPYRMATRAKDGDRFEEMSGTGANHHVHGPDLPPVCPMVRHHTDIEFPANSDAMDPFGLPCLLEMHWSIETAPGFDAMRCSRKYQLSGFTDWSCHGVPQVPSRYNMVFHIECVDVAPDGTLTGENIDSHVITNPSWKGEGDNPSLTPGHYCYLRFAIEDNPEWSYARNTVLIVAGVGAMFMIVGFVVASTCAAVVTNTFYAFAIASISGVSFMVIQFSEYLTPEALWWLPMGNVVIFLAMTGCWIVPITSDFIQYRLLRRKGERDQEEGEPNEEEALPDEAGPTIKLDYDVLAVALSRVEHSRKVGQDLRPRGEMASAISALDKPPKQEEGEGEETNKED